MDRAPAQVGGAASAAGGSVLAARGAAVDTALAGTEPVARRTRRSHLGKQDFARIDRDCRLHQSAGAPERVEVGELVVAEATGGTGEYDFDRLYARGRDEWGLAGS